MYPVSEGTKQAASFERKPRLAVRISEPPVSLRALMMPSAARTGVFTQSRMNRPEESECEQLSRIYARLNTRTPIYNLPTELLLEIFTHLQGGADRLAWLNVLLVCKHWYQVGSSATTLWWNITVKGSVNLLCTSLARSGKTQLNVELVPCRPHPLLKVIGILVGPHLSRLRSLSLESISTAILPAFAAFMNNLMPALCSLHVTAEPLEGSGLISLNLSRTAFPQLRELHTVHMNVFGDLEIFSQLRKVKIEGCDGVNPELKAETIVEAVRRMQLVEELDLDEVNVPDILEDTPDEAETDRIELKHLRNIVLSIDGPLIKAILSAVTIPATTTISCTSLFLSEYYEASSPDLQAVVPENQTGLPVLSQIVAATITTAENMHQLQGYTTLKDLLPGGAGARVDFYITIRSEAITDMDDVPVGLDDLVHVLGDAPLEHLKVQTTAEIFERTDWPGVLAAFPGLRSIQLDVLQSDESDDEYYSTRACTQSFLRALDPSNAAVVGAAHDGGETPGSSMCGGAVLCPDLRHLEMSGEQLTDGTALTNLGICLGNRRRALGLDAREGRLERLTVLSTDDHHRDEAHFLATRAMFVEKLSPLVDEVIYENNSEDSA